MGNVIHETKPVQVWADVDIGIAWMVERMNTIPGVRTHSSCQGTIGEGGAEPYRPYVMASWLDDVTFKQLATEFEFDHERSDEWTSYGCFHPKTAQQILDAAPPPPKSKKDYDQSA